VGSGYHCCGLGLVQGDEVVSHYAFLPPAAYDALAARYQVYELRRPNEPGKAALGGRDAVFLAAENARWQSGAELLPADFEALLAHLAARRADFTHTAASGAAP
jgi:hypothetical protein